MIIVITGPTGVGKTKLSISLAKHLNGEVINADSMQVYKGLDIGTAKIKESEKEGIKHHLFDIKDVVEDYTVFDYQKDVRNTINSILESKKTPIMVGGTGLYIKASLYNYEFKEEDNKKEYLELSDQELLDEINKYKIDINFDIHNRRRLVRVLNKLENNNYNDIVSNKEIFDDIIYIGLTTDRDHLYSIINDRVDKMFNEGLIDEVKYFYDKNIKSKALLTGIGYKEVYDYLDNVISLDECKELIKQRSRKYAKRQYTFFNHQLPIKWFNVNYEDFSKTVDEVIKYIKKIDK